MRSALIPSTTTAISSLVVAIQLSLLQSPLPLIVNAHWPHDTIEGIAVNEDGLFISNGGYLVFSKDVGKSFQLQRMRRIAPIDESIAISSKYSIDKTLYMYTKFKEFCVSTDSGINFHCLFDACSTQELLPYDGNAEFIASVAGNAITVDKDYNIRRSLAGDNAANFDEIIDLGFNLTSCPALAADNVNRIMYLGTSDGELYQSNDYGTTWTLRLHLLSSSSSSSSTLVIRRIVPVGDDEIFILTNDNDDMIYYFGPSGMQETITLPPVDDDDRIRVDWETPIIMVSAHRVERTTTLFVVRDNAYRLWYTRDNGENWSIRGTDDGFLDYCCDNAWTNGDKEMTQIIPMPNSLRVWAATYSGLYLSEDDGDTWTHIDTKNKDISGISVASISDTEFQIGFSTVMDGTYQGTIEIRGASVSKIDISTVPPGDYHENWYMPFWIHAISPNYKNNKSSYRFGLHLPTGYRFERSRDAFQNDIFLMTVPTLDANSSEEYQIQDIEFDKSDGIYICGWNIGIAASYDDGESWSTYWNPKTLNGLSNSEVLEVSLSPSYEIDGTMAVVVLVDGGDQHPQNDLSSPKEIYVTDNFGVDGSWWKLDLPFDKFSSIAMMAGTTSAPILILTEYRSKKRPSPKLYAVKLDDVDSFRALSEIDYEEIRPAGYSSRQALVTSPDGTVLAAAFTEGSMVVGSINAATLQVENAHLAKPEPKEESSQQRRRSLQQEAVVIFATDFVLYDFDGYSADMFRSTHKPGYGGGWYTSNKQLIGAWLGGVDNSFVTGMSSGHMKSFTLTTASTTTLLEFRYEVTLESTFETGENIEVLCSIDGIVHVIEKFNGPTPSMTTSWKTVNIDLGSLSAGTHQIRLGGYLSKKDEQVERARIAFDNVSIKVVTTGSGEESNSNSIIIKTDFSTYNFDGVKKDVFRDTYNSGVYAGGWYAPGSQWITTSLGGVDNTVITRMSAGHIKSYTLTNDAIVTIKFRYTVLFDSGFEYGEDTEILCSVDGTVYVVNTFLGVNSPTTVWWKAATINVGAQSAKTHTMVLGGYLSKKDNSAERVRILFDDVIVAATPTTTATDPATSPPTPPTPSPVVASSTTTIKEIFQTDFGTAYNFDEVDKDIFRNTNSPNYSGGWYSSKYKWIVVWLGGVDNNSVIGMSAGQTKSYTLLYDAVNVIVQFRYKVEFDSNFEDGEDIEVLCSSSASGGVVHVIEKFYGSGVNSPSTTEWKTSTVHLGYQSATARAPYRLVLGGYLSRKDHYAERVRILFDDVHLTAVTASSPTNQQPPVPTLPPTTTAPVGPSYSPFSVTTTTSPTRAPIITDTIISIDDDDEQTSTTPIFFGCEYNRNEIEFAHLNVITYSPNFVIDGIMFAREYYTIYISFNRGIDWKKIITLPHTTA